MASQHRFVAVVGMAGSGKSIVSDALVAEGFAYVRFGQLTLDEIKRRGLPVTEENERAIREGFRREHGMAAYAILNIPKFDKLLEEGDVVGDGLYSWSEYKVLKDRYGDRLVVLAVFATPKTRYTRLAARKLDPSDTNLRNRPIPPEQAAMRDRTEIENIEKAGPIAMADYLILNEGDVAQLKEQTRRFLEWLGEHHG